MSLADRLLEKTKQQKLRATPSFAPNFKKPNIGGASSATKSTNNITPATSSNSVPQTETNNELSAIGLASMLSSPPTMSLSFNPTQDNPADQSILSSTSTTSTIIATGGNSSSSGVGVGVGGDNNDDAVSTTTSNSNNILPTSDDNNNTTKKDKKKKPSTSREKKRRRKTIDSDDEEYVDPPQEDGNEEDAISTTSAKSSASSKTKRLKKPTGEFKTISDFIRDAILNDYESENTNINNNNNNNRSNMNNSSAQQNGISADEFINEEDEFEIENDDQYKDRVHQIEMEEDENVNNSDNVSAMSGKSSYKNFVEVKAPSFIPPNPYKPSDHNSEFGDDDDLDSEFGDLEKPAGGPSVFSFDNDGNILMKPAETEEALIPFMESGRQEFNYSRAMRLANLDANKPVTQATYARKGKGERWTKDDLELFYDGLRQFGTDFSMISRLFPKRTRREVHQKYKNEEKKNKKKIEFALKNRAPINMTLFQKKSKEKDKIQGITRKKVTKTTEVASSDANEDEWKEVTSTSKTTSSSYEQAIDDEFEEDEFDIDDYDPEEDEKKYERPVSKPQSSTASSSTNNIQDEFEEVEMNEEDETFDNFGNNVLGRGEDEFE